MPLPSFSLTFSYNEKQFFEPKKCKPKKQFVCITNSTSKVLVCGVEWNMHWRCVGVWWGVWRGNLAYVEVPHPSHGHPSPHQWRCHRIQLLDHKSRVQLKQKKRGVCIFYISLRSIHLQQNSFIKKQLHLRKFKSLNLNCKIKKMKLKK